MYVTTKIWIVNEAVLCVILLFRNYAWCYTHDLEENASQHELIGVAYGETIDDAADEIDECIKADLIADEDNIYTQSNVDVKPFDPAVLQLEQYEYAASGILYPADSNVPENIIHEYGIRELKCEN